METPPMSGTDLFKLVMQYHMLGHPIATIALETGQTEPVIVEMLDEMIRLMADSIRHHQAQPPKGIVCSLPRKTQAVMYWHTLGYTHAAIANRTNLTTEEVITCVEAFADSLGYMPDEEPAGESTTTLGTGRVEPTDDGPTFMQGPTNQIREVGPLAIIDYKGGRLSVSLDMTELPEVDLEAGLRSLLQLLASYKPV